MFGRDWRGLAGSRDAPFSEEESPRRPPFATLSHYCRAVWIGAQRMVYVLDLTQPNGLFLARDFAVRDEDTVYVTEAPFVQWSKTLAAVTGSLATATSVASLSGSN